MRFGTTCIIFECMTERNPRTMTAMALATDGSFTPVELDRPTAGPTEVLIEVSAAGINPADWKSAADQAAGAVDGAPVILGWDVAGEVVEVGPGVTRFAVGDRVFGMPRFPAPANAYAQFVVARSREVALVPACVGDAEAGALPLAVLTAWQALVDALHIAEGDKLLIHAASGGVGHLAVQIAKAMGAEVWGTASAGKHEVLRDLGADHLIDYRSQRFEDVVPAMDAVLDLVGDGETSARSVGILRRGGRLAAISPLLPSSEVLDAAGVTAQFVLVEPDYAALEAVATMLEEGTLRVVIADTRPLADIGELHAIGKAGSPLGKLVATVR